MSYLRVLFYSCLVLLLVEVLHGQQATSNDDIKFYHCSCSVIQRALSTRTRMGVGGADDDYTAAAVACDSLKKAVDTSDPQQIQSAATNLHSILRPILWDVGCIPRLGMAPASPQQQLAALEKKTAGLDGKALFYKLPDLAKLAFSAGDIDKAEAYSEQLLQIAPQYPKDWNYGNAIYYGNFVLGRIAVQRGNLVQAGQYLLCGRWHARLAAAQQLRAQHDPCQGASGEGPVRSGVAVFHSLQKLLEDGLWQAGSMERRNPSRRDTRLNRRSVPIANATWSV